jgi:hypothetical protein
MPMRLWMLAAAPLSLSLSLAGPALAGKHQLRVTATILAACSLGAHGMRCTGRDGKVAYRINTGTDGVVTIEF